MGEMQINERFIEHVNYVNGKFVIVASDFSRSGNDLNNFPKNRYKFIVEYDDDDGNEPVWKLVSKEFIGVNQY